MSKLSPLFLFFLFSLSTDVIAEELPTAKVINDLTIVNCGEIEATPSVAVQDEPQTKHGYVFVMDELETPKFKPGCPKVSAVIGSSFGIQVQVNGRPDMAIVELVTRWTHPVIKNPETGREGSVDEWNSPMNIGLARYAGWKFDQEWELVPGKWKIEILYRDKIMAMQEFEVMLPQK